AAATGREVVAAPAIGAMDARGRRGLVWSLVAGETRDAVRTEHLALAELVRHLLQQREERLTDGLVVDVAIRLEPVPGVVRLNALEPGERGRRPSPKWRDRAHRRSTQSSHPRTPAVWAFAGGVGDASAAACTA